MLRFSLLLKSEILLKRVTTLQKHIEIVLAYHNRPYRLLQIEAIALHHRAVMFEFLEIGESLHNQQADVGEAHLLKVEILDHERGEVEPGHFIEQLVGVDLIARESEHEILGRIRVALESSRSAVGIHRPLFRVGETGVPEHATRVGNTGVRFTSLLEPLHYG